MPRSSLEFYGHQSLRVARKQLAVCQRRRRPAWLTEQRFPTRFPVGLRRRGEYDQLAVLVRDRVGEHDAPPVRLLDRCRSGEHERPRPVESEQHDLAAVVVPRDLLRPEVGPDGALILTSPLGSFGDDGAYLVVVRPDGRSGWVRRVPLAERFLVWVDAERVLRTDHSLNLWQIPVIRLHYRLEHRSAA